MPFLAVSSTWKYVMCICVTKSHVINEYQYLKILRTSRNFRFEMHQAGCRDAVLHYNYELGYGLWGEESIKAKKKRAVSPSSPPTTPHKPPKWGHKTNPKQGSLCFYEGKPRCWFLKAFYFKREGGKETFGEWNRNIYKPSLLLNWNQEGERLTSELHPSCPCLRFLHSFDLSCRFHAHVAESMFSILMRLPYSTLCLLINNLGPKRESTM